MRKAEIVTAFILGLFSIYVMYKSGEPSPWDPAAGRFDNIGLVEGEGPGSGFWPFWLGLFMLISCIWIAINWYRRTSPPSQSDEVFLDAFGLRMLATVGGGLLGFFVLIQLLGYYGAIFVFLIYYMGFLGRHSILQTLSIAVIVPIVGFFFFDVAMRIILPKGYLEPLFLPLYAIFL